MSRPADPDARGEAAGRLVAAALRGSWRSSSPGYGCSAGELERITPQLLGSGAAALVWRRARSAVPAAEALHDAYRGNILQAAIQERTIERATGLLRSARIEPLLVKGWVAVRLYPDPGLRPPGDVDLCVRAEELAGAEAALRDLEPDRSSVDLHAGFAKFGGGSFTDICERSHAVRLGTTTVRVPSPEDHLRVLCIHMLREGAWRPLWLCDVAAAVESRSRDFDWDRCLTGDATRASWVLCAIRLAHELLGADVSGTPAAERGRPLPRWLVPVILREWGSPVTSMSRRYRTPMARHLRQPAGLLGGLRDRWPNPIEATVGMRRPFGEWPRTPLQLGNCLVRTATFALRLPELARRMAPDVHGGRGKAVAE